MVTSGTVRALTAADDDQVIDVLVASSLFDRDDVPLLRSLLMAHHDGTAAAGQRWSVITGRTPAENDDQQPQAGAENIFGTALYRPVEAADRVWDLTMIGVRADSQNLGFGRGLLEHLEGQLQSEHQRLIVVQTSGLQRFERTRAFYRTLGYTQHGRVPDYWADGDDMLLYSKPLAPLVPGVTAREGNT